jgi:tetratricopeptide (TPR) repeat protein
MAYLIAVIIFLILIILFLLFYSPKSRVAENREQFESAAGPIFGQQASQPDRAGGHALEQVPAETGDGTQITAEQELVLSFEDEIILDEPELTIDRETGEEGPDTGEYDGVPAAGLIEEEVGEEEEIEILLTAEHEEGRQNIRHETTPALAGFVDEAAVIHGETPEDLEEKLNFFFTRREEETAAPVGVEQAGAEQDAPEAAAGFSLQEYEAELDQLVQKSRGELAEAIEQQDTARLSLLETQLTRLCTLQADTGKGFQEQQALMTAVEKSIGELQTELGHDFSAARGHLRHRKYEAAISMLDEASDRLESSAGPASRLRYRCGRLAEARGDFAGAFVLYEKACAGDGDDPDCLFAAGRTAAILGRHEEARQYLEKRLAMGQQAAGLAAARHELARVLLRQEMKDQAEPLLQSAMALLEQEGGADHPDLGPVLHDLAALYESLGRYEEAEPLYRRALAVIEQGAWPDHPMLAATMNRLAGLYEEMEQEERSGPLYAKAIEIKKKVLGEDHPDIGTMLNHLANLLKQEGRHAEAEPMFRRSLEIGERSLGPDHPNLAVVLNNLAELYEEMGREDEAAHYQERAFALFELPGTGGDFVEMEKDDVEVDHVKNQTIAGN